MVSTLKLELFLVFILIPVFIAACTSSTLVFTFLYLVFFYAITFLKNKNFNFNKLKKRIDWNFTLIWLVIFVVCGFIYTIILDKNLLFSLPKENFKLWLLVVFLYPLFSVLPQEIIFRVFFFKRYQNILGEKVFVKYLVNTIIFSFGHIVFNNFHAVLITFLVSPLFSYAYERKSFLTCVTIHSLGGQIIFTLGLGKFFI